tara:strand:+ start:48089 stop:48394 length:306 start_codon:yes stop_codon:yes gene_type:complete
MKKLVAMVMIVIFVSICIGIANDPSADAARTRENLKLRNLVDENRQHVLQVYNQLIELTGWPKIDKKLLPIEKGLRPRKELEEINDFLILLNFYIAQHDNF